MDWRFIVAGFIISIGLLVGWRNTGTVGGAIVAAGLLSALFVVSWLIDQCVYDL